MLVACLAANTRFQTPEPYDISVCLGAMTKRMVPGIKQRALNGENR